MIPTREQYQLARLNKSLEYLFQQLEAYSEEQLNHQPDPNTWSPLMVVKHLMMAEEYSMKYVQKKLSFNPDIPGTGIHTHLRSWVLEFYFISPFKWEAPKAIADENLTGPHEIETLKQQWWEQRTQLKKLLEEISPDRYHQEVYKHPFAGRLSISGMLRFFQGHFKRHRKQIERRLII